MTSLPALGAVVYVVTAFERGYVIEQYVFASLAPAEAKLDELEVTYGVKNIMFAPRVVQ